MHPLTDLPEKAEQHVSTVITSGVRKISLMSSILAAATCGYQALFVVRSALYVPLYGCSVVTLDRDLSNIWPYIRRVFSVQAVRAVSNADRRADTQHCIVATPDRIPLEFNRSSSRSGLLIYSSELPTDQLCSDGSIYVPKSRASYSFLNTTEMW